MGEPREDSTASVLAKAIEANAFELTAHVGRFPDDEFYDGHDLIRVKSGIPRPAWNGIHRARFAAEDADAGIEELLRFSRSRRLPFTWIIGPSTRPPDLGERLVAHGLTHDRDEIGMAVDLQRMNENSPAPPNLVVERASDEKTLRDNFHPQAVVYDVGVQRRGPPRKGKGLGTGSQFPPAALCRLLRGGTGSGLHDVPGERRSGGNLRRGHPTGGEGQGHRYGHDH